MSQLCDPGSLLPDDHQQATLANRVSTAEAAPDWIFRIRRLIGNLAGRGLLDATGGQSTAAQPAGRSDRR